MLEAENDAIVLAVGMGDDADAGLSGTTSPASGVAAVHRGDQDGQPARSRQRASS